jgi:hypothetical protein
VTNDIAEWDAAYVLGALSPADRDIYEAYLATDLAHSASLRELDQLLGLLDALSPEEAVALIEMPSPATVTTRRRRLSRRTLVAASVGAAAAIALTAGIAGETAIPVVPRSETEAVALTAMQSTEKAGIRAALAVTEKKWGTRLDWTCEYTNDSAKKAPSYDIVVTTDEGAESAVGTWRPANDRATGLAASTAIPTRKIRTVDIRVSGTHEPLAITKMH